MTRLTSGDKARNEAAVRAAMDRLLRGEIPAAGSCDIKTLAAEAGVPRTGFYAKKGPDGAERPGPYQHLAKEFDRRLTALRARGEAVDPKQGQIDRLKDQIADLKGRATARDALIAELTRFQQLAISRLAAQHDEITRLRQHQSEAPAHVLPPVSLLGSRTPPAMAHELNGRVPEHAS